MVWEKYFVKSVGTLYCNKRCKSLLSVDIFQAVEARHLVGSSVSMLVNNAGVVFGNDVLDSQPEDIQKTIEVNTLAHFWVSSMWEA